MIRTVVIALITTASVAATPSLAADLAGDATAFGCMPKGAVTSLLPALGYSDITRVGEQKGVTYFDA